LNLVFLLQAVELAREYAMQQPSHRIALLIDYDNAQIAANEEGFRNCAESTLWATPLIRAVEAACDGSVDIRRVYGNVLHYVTETLRSREWNSRALRENMELDLTVQNDLSRQGFQVIHCPSNSFGKNRADILMALDCMEIATNYGHIDTFAIMSNDSDFSPLIQRLRALGKRVALVTVGKLSEERVRILASLATIRIAYDQKVIDQGGPSQLFRILKELQNAPEGFPSQGIAIESLRQKIREVEPDFQPQSLGFSKMGEFIMECVDPEKFQFADGKGKSVLLLKMPSVAKAKPAAKAPDRPSFDKPPDPPVIVESSEPVMPDRIQIIKRALGTKDLRFLPGHWHVVLARIQQFCTERQSQAEPKTFGQLQEHLMQPEVLGTELSKSRIRDILKLFLSSGVLAGNRGEGVSLRELTLESVDSESTAKEKILLLAKNIVEGSGLTLLPDDSALLSQLTIEWNLIDSPKPSTEAESPALIASTFPEPKSET
jgi:uncharacterized LabA/DUF88 family protein